MNCKLEVRNKNIAVYFPHLFADFISVFFRLNFLSHFSLYENSLSQKLTVYKKQHSNLYNYLFKSFERICVHKAFTMLNSWQGVVDKILA